MKAVERDYRFERICSDRGFSTEVMVDCLNRKGMSVDDFVSNYSKMSISALDDLLKPPVMKPKKVVPVVLEDYFVLVLGGYFGVHRLEALRLDVSMMDFSLEHEGGVCFLRNLSLLRAARVAAEIVVVLKVKAANRKGAMDKARERFVPGAVSEIKLRDSFGFVPFVVDRAVLVGEKKINRNDISNIGEWFK